MKRYWMVRFTRVGDKGLFDHSIAYITCEWKNIAKVMKKRFSDIKGLSSATEIGQGE
jgi:hypothetical protein